MMDIANDTKKQDAIDQQIFDEKNLRAFKPGELAQAQTMLDGLLPTGDVPTNVNALVSDIGEKQRGSVG